jgi:hypothetical protein
LVAEDGDSSLLADLNDDKEDPNSWFKAEDDNDHRRLHSSDDDFNPFATSNSRSAASKSITSHLMNASDDSQRLRTLIVLPLSLMEQWKLEFDEFVRPKGRLKILQYHGGFMTTGERRYLEQNPEKLGKYDSK